MALKNKNNKYLYAFVISGVSIFFLILMFFVLKGIFYGNKKISLEVKINKEKLDVLEEKLTKLKDLKNKEKELLTEKERLLSALPEKKDIPRLFIQFERMIDSTGSKVSSANGSSALESATQEVPGITTYDYTLQASTTTYESFKNIILNSENALRLLNITGFTIGTADNKSFDLSFSLKAFGRGEALK